MLFRVIGVTYGGCELSGHFRVPDLTSRFPLGASHAHTLASTGGAETVTLDIPHIPVHTHTGTTDLGGAHGHTSNSNSTSHLGLTGTGSQTSTADPIAIDNYGDTEPNLLATPTILSIDVSDPHTHTFTSNATGGGLAHENMPPFLTMNYIIKC
jgi:microcystin-dependent protein